MEGMFIYYFKAFRLEHKEEMLEYMIAISDLGFRSFNTSCYYFHDNIWRIKSAVEIEPRVRFRSKAWYAFCKRFKGTFMRIVNKHFFRSENVLKNKDIVDEALLFLARTKTTPTLEVEDFYFSDLSEDVRDPIFLKVLTELKNKRFKLKKVKPNPKRWSNYDVTSFDKSKLRKVTPRLYNVLYINDKMLSQVSLKHVDTIYKDYIIFRADWGNRWRKETRNVMKSQFKKRMRSFGKKIGRFMLRVFRVKLMLCRYRAAKPFLISEKDKYLAKRELELMSLEDVNVKLPSDKKLASTLYKESLLLKKRRKVPMKRYCNCVGSKIFREPKKEVSFAVMYRGTSKSYSCEKCLPGRVEDRRFAFLAMSLKISDNFKTREKLVSEIKEANQEWHSKSERGLDVGSVDSKIKEINDKILKTWSFS
jgi:hypothetical protein